MHTERPRTGCTCTCNMHEQTPIVKKTPKWILSCNGQVPSTAVIAGVDDNKELLCVGRVLHEGAMVPGKVKPSEGVCYVPWGGKEYFYTSYEVLCDYTPDWVPVINKELPSNAFVGGYTGCGRPLYVGRCRHLHSVTPGKVQGNNKVCYIPYDKFEIEKYGGYEVLVV